ncbi:DNA glycosylase AlkZ-like family protein [Actinoplanes sp. NPDC049599]|uniref:DNA glycosylase AlkZ-like family protein n=1 Tax=Actinoplanes sp. NPDC049599 TaxID=3363903 RepID=UPI0037B9C73D
MVHRLDRAEARRIAVRAQLLDLPRPADLATVVDRLTFLQIDPTAAVAPTADLVAWSRLGPAYRPADLTRALEQDRTLVEIDAMIRPVADLGLHVASAQPRPVPERTREWLRVNEPFRKDVLARLAAAGPLLSREIADTSVVAWPSTGWTDNRNVTKMLEHLVRAGEAAIAGRRGRQRLWDLAERVYPAAVPVVPPAEADRRRRERTLRSLGIVRENLAGPVGEPAVVDGVPGTWRVDPAAIGRPFTGRTALLSPFDRLVHDRVRLLDLFAFEYVLEMYKPKAARRWGYFALPILHGDRLIGKLDATVDRRAGTLVVHALHEDTPGTPAMTEAVRHEINDLAHWLGVAVVTGAGAARLG